jgi:hypothetical protein
MSDAVRVLPCSAVACGGGSGREGVTECVIKQEQKCSDPTKI